MLDQLAPLEHADVREAVLADVDDHEVATGRATLATRTPASLQGLVVERIEQCCPVDIHVAEFAGVDVLDGTAALAAATAAGPVLIPGGCRRGGRATGRRTLTTFAATATAPPAPALLGRAVRVGRAVLGGPVRAGIVVVGGRRPPGQAGCRRSSVATQARDG